MRKLSSPITVHLEVTQKCNERCRHCYNSSHTPQSITGENLNKTIDELIKNKVMHVIITGGEPLLEMDKVIYLAKKSIGNGMSVSLNSNCILMNEYNVKMLLNAGITHCLTTLHSYNAQGHNKVAGVDSFDKIIKGIKLAQSMGLRITVNSVLLDSNKRDVFKIGKLCQSIGVKKYLCNRVIPDDNGFIAGKQEVRKMVSDLLKLRDTGMEVGTCRMIPECFFGNVDEVPEFINRGCSAGRRHMLLNINGDSHACVHESKSYGNIHEIGLRGCWDNMYEWRSLAYVPSECINCPRIESCEGGCRMVALKQTGSMNGKDILHDSLQAIPPIKDKQINVREEDDFYIIRERGAKVRFIDKSSRCRTC